jgi:hypothetical protein
MADRSLTAALATLGLPPDASPEDIKRAWRKTARETHPDLNPGDPDAARRFTEAEAAHALLADPARREGAALYDAAARARGGPDEDWFDACAWMAESHLIHLRRDTFPRYAAWHRGGPSLVAALAHAAERGIAEGAPDVTPTRWARLWARYTWRRVDLVVEDGYSFGRGPVGIVTKGSRVQIYLFPRVLWDQGVRDDEAVRRVVVRSVDAGVATAALIVLGLRPDPSPPADADRRWWIAQLAWPVLLVLVALFSALLIGTAWLEANHLR